MTDGEDKTAEPTSSFKGAEVAHELERDQIMDRGRDIVLNAPQLFVDVDVEADVTAAVTGATEETSAPFQLMLQFELSPSDTPKLQLADRGGADNTVLRKVYDAALAVTAPSPSAQALSFQVMFNVNSPTQP